MPIKVETYVCQYCGEEFPNIAKCEEHETTHIKRYENASVSEVIKALKNIEDSVYAHRIGNEIMGIPIQSFISLIDAAVERLWWLQAAGEKADP